MIRFISNINKSVFVYLSQLKSGLEHIPVNLSTAEYKSYLQSLLDDYDQNITQLEMIESEMNNSSE